MPWCPQCKSEFQDGYTQCSDCRVPLVADLAEQEGYIPFFQSERKNLVDKLRNYFKYSELASVIRYNPDNTIYTLYLPASQLKNGKKLYQAFYYVEWEQHIKQVALEKAAADLSFSSADDSSQDETDADDINSVAPEEIIDDVEFESSISDTEMNEMDMDITNSEEDIPSHLFQDGPALYSDVWDKHPPNYEDDEDESEDSEDLDIQYIDKEDTSAYVMKADRYKDYASSVFTFLFLGIAGCIFVLLHIVGILNFLNGWFGYTVMGGVFLLFIYLGISTNARAKKIQGEIEAEQLLTENINQWLSEHLTPEYMASLTDDSMSKELSYIKMTDEVKARLNDTFGRQNENYLDQIIETYYTEHIEE